MHRLFLNRLTCLSVVLAAASICAPAQVVPQNQGNSTPPKPARVRTQMDGFDLSPQKKTKNQNQIGGASRGLGELTLYAPHTGKCYSGKPLFQWSLGGPGVKVHFVLKDAAGAVVYQTTVETNHLQYPADAPALTPGSTYSWTVQPEIDMMGGQSAPAQIAIVGGTERQKIADQLAIASGADPMLAAAKVFVDNRIWYDAVGDYTDLIAKHPEVKGLYRERGTVYDQLPQTEALARKDFSTADSL